MSAESIRIINQAISRMSGNTITAVDDGTSEATLADLNYEQIVTTELSISPWKFARATGLLTALPDAPADTDWDYALALPDGLLQLRTVIKDGQPIDYEIAAGSVLTDDDDEVYAVYTYRAAEDDWPADFKEGVIKRLEAIFLRAEDRYSEGALRDEDADRMFAKARLAHSQSEAPRDKFTYPLLDSRRTGRAPLRR